MLETRQDLLRDMSLPDGPFPSLDAFVLGAHTYIRDLRINPKNPLASPHLGRKLVYLIVLAVAVNDKSPRLVSTFTAFAQKEGVDHAEIAEIHAVASLLSTLNVYYRFNHFVDNKHYETLQAGITMTIMARPVLGKLNFELLSLVVSAVNGCQTSVNCHEEAVRHDGGTQELIFDAVRLGAVVQGLCVAVQEFD